MSRRVTISVPDDVADQLEALPPRQVSAYVTDSLRRRRISDDIRAAVRATGNRREYPYDPEGARQRIADSQPTPQMREEAIARVAERMGRPVDEVRAEFDR
jgi:hypothetical protein